MTSIWAQLGIAPSKDAREIKRAYARKLKTVRPDEDPHAFQKLREARDEALWLASFDDHSFDEAATPPDEAAIPPGEDGAPLSLAPDQGEAIDSSTGTPPGGAGEETAQPPADEIAKEPLAPPAEPVEPVAGESEIIVEEIERQFSPWSDPWEREAWEAILSHMAKLDIWQRQDIQHHILQHIGKAVDDTLSGELSIGGRERRNAVLLLLNEEFGWSQDDRIIYDSMEEKQADQLSDLIRRISQANRYFRDGEMDRSGFPILSMSDIDAYFSHNKISPYMLYYAESMNLMEWKEPAWHWPAFFFSYVWMAWRGMAGKSFMILFVSMAGSLAFALGKAFNISLLFTAGSACLAVSHIYVGLNAKRWVLEKAKAAINEVNEKNIFEEKERMAALTSKGKKRSWLLLFLVTGLSLIGKALFRLI